MKWQNKVQLIGYLGDDPKLIQFRSGAHCFRFRLATSNGYTTENKKRITTWHTIKAWGRKPHHIQNNFIKGSHVLVEGILYYRTYQDKNGFTRHFTDIDATTLINLDR